VGAKSGLWTGIVNRLIPWVFKGYLIRFSISSRFLSKTTDSDFAASAGLSAKVNRRLHQDGKALNRVLVVAVRTLGFTKAFCSSLCFNNSWYRAMQKKSPGFLSAFLNVTTTGRCLSGEESALFESIVTIHVSCHSNTQFETLVQD
jgi:hypothetical protein